MNYKIVWEIDLDADDPIDAAQQAMNSVAFGTAKVFVLQDENEEMFSVDLEDESMCELKGYKPLIKGI